MTTSNTAVWPGRFENRGFIVTGAAGAIGRTVVERLAAEGARILAADTQPTAPDFESDRITYTVLDVRDREAWAAVVEQAVALSIHDGIAFCHGVHHRQVPTTELSTEEWQFVQDVNVLGCLLGIQAVLPVLTERGWGRILALASIAAKEASIHEHAYAASKAAVVALIKSVGKEVATTGVTANSIAPGPVGTEMFYKLGAEHNADRMRRSPMGRPATTAEVASLAAWLLSEESSYTTAQCYDISGGRATY